MESNMIYFLISVASAFILVFLVSKVWFASTRSCYLIIFLLMGVMASLWSLLNGVTAIVEPQTVMLLQPMWMVFVCCLPFLMLMYILHFVNAKLAGSRILTGILIVIMLTDIALLLTNPLHKLYYTSYTPEGSGVYGPFFWLHSYVSYLVLGTAFVLLIIHIVRNVRKYPHLLFILFGSACPFIANLLYVFHIYRSPYDLTPLGFVLMFTIYALFSIRFRLFNIKTAASANIFDTLSEGFLVINNIGQVAAYNPAFQKAFPALKMIPDQTMVQDVAEYMQSAAVKYHPDDIFDKITSLNEKLPDCECSIQGQDGKIYDFSLVKDFIMQRGQSAGFVLTLTDISNYQQMIAEINEQNVKLTELKDSAEAASRAKTDFLANMSHEIRTPMNAIIGLTNIARNSQDITHIHTLLGKLDNASHQLLSIINDVLDMSKIEANKLELYYEDFLFTDMLLSCNEIFIDRVQEKQQHLQFDIAPDVPPVLHGDKLRLSQVIINLLSNAVKFTPEGGSIRLTASLVSVTDSEAGIRVSVTDTGIGLTKEQLSRLFSAFEQADGSISRNFGGTGLGLALSKNIVQLMGGQIWAESTPGEGSTFSFEFMAKIGETAILPKPQEQDLSYDFSGRTVLLAEDVEINREIIIALLEETKISIDCAVNGQEAYDMFRQTPEKYDLIYMDLQMPKLDGYSATKMIRALDHPAAGTIPIIAMTANAFVEDVRKCLEMGMNDHISKPIDIHILLKKTAEYLQ